MINMLRVLLLASLVACSLGAATRRRPRLDGRIVGGQAVNIEDFPYQLSFEYGGSHICGGSIISLYWAVTSGYCSHDLPVSSSRFRAGTNVLGSGGTIHPAEAIIVHPLYDYYFVDFDIAVARVYVPFNNAIKVQPIPLTYIEPAVGNLTVASGWGTLSSDNITYSSQLQAVELSIISRSECNSSFVDYGGVSENMICAAVDGGGKGTCRGDLGGPLVVDGVLVGIASRGIGCGDPDYPAVFSNVAVLRSFVTNETGVQ